MVYSFQKILWMIELPWGTSDSVTGTRERFCFDSNQTKLDDHRRPKKESPLNPLVEAVLKNVCGFHVFWFWFLWSGSRHLGASHYEAYQWMQCALNLKNFRYFSWGRGEVVAVLFMSSKKLLIWYVILRWCDSIPDPSPWMRFLFACGKRWIEYVHDLTPDLPVFRGEPAARRRNSRNTRWILGPYHHDFIRSSNTYNVSWLFLNCESVSWLSIFANLRRLRNWVWSRPKSHGGCKKASLLLGCLNMCVCMVMVCLNNVKQKHIIIYLYYNIFLQSLHVYVQTTNVIGVRIVYI